MSPAVKLACALQYVPSVAIERVDTMWDTWIAIASRPRMTPMRLAYMITLCGLTGGCDNE